MIKMLVIVKIPCIHKCFLLESLLLFVALSQDLSINNSSIIALSGVE